MVVQISVKALALSVLLFAGGTYLGWKLRGQYEHFMTAPKRDVACQGPTTFTWHATNQRFRVLPASSTAGIASTCGE